MDYKDLAGLFHKYMYTNCLAMHGKMQTYQMANFVILVENNKYGNYKRAG